MNLILYFCLLALGGYNFCTFVEYFTMMIWSLREFDRSWPIRESKSGTEQTCVNNRACGHSENTG